MLNQNTKSCWNHQLSLEWLNSKKFYENNLQICLIVIYSLVPNIRFVLEREKWQDQLNDREGGNCWSDFKLHPTTVVANPWHACHTGHAEPSLLADMSHFPSIIPAVGNQMLNVCLGNPSGKVSGNGTDSSCVERFWLPNKCRSIFRWQDLNDKKDDMYFREKLSQRSHKMRKTPKCTYKLLESKQILRSKTMPNIYHKKVLHKYLSEISNT